MTPRREATRVFVSAPLWLSTRGTRWALLGLVLVMAAAVGVAVGPMITGPVDRAAPTPGSDSTITTTGRALAFEGTVQVEVRADGGLGPIAQGFVTGGDDVMHPFAGFVAFETPGAP